MWLMNWQNSLLGHWQVILGSLFIFQNPALLRNIKLGKKTLTPIVGPCQYHKTILV